MRRASRILLSAAFLLGLLAPRASGQFEEPVMYYYDYIVQNGGAVYGYVWTSLQEPTNPCPWSGFCWDEYTSYAEANLYLDNFWLGGYWYSQPDNYAYVWVQDTVWPGEWVLEAKNEVHDIWYRDNYNYSWFEPSIWCIEYPTLTIAPEISISGDQYADDGGTGYFNVTAQGGTPTAYQWWFMNYEVAGNSPNVIFNPPNSTPTLTDAHWYAYPNDQCLAQKEAYYEVGANVWFGSFQLATSTTHLYVNAGPDKAGETFVPQILGSPAIDLVGGVYRVISVDNPYVLGTAPKFVYVQPSSQFYYKADAHENVHVSQWQPGGYLRNNGVFDLEYFWNQVKGMTAPTWVALVSSILQAQNTFWSGNAILALVYENGAEAEAYAYSDTLDPMYCYQNCGRY